MHSHMLGGCSGIVFNYKSVDEHWRVVIGDGTCVMLVGAAIATAQPTLCLFFSNKLRMAKSTLSSRRTQAGVTSSRKIVVLIPPTQFQSGQLESAHNTF